MNKILAGAIVLSFLIISVALHREGYTLNKSDDREEISCQLVDKILNDSYQIDSVKCEKVKIQEALSDNFYRGQAYLSNGSVKDIGIKTESGSISVTMQLY